MAENSFDPTKEAPIPANVLAAAKAAEKIQQDHIDGNTGKPAAAVVDPISDPVVEPAKPVPADHSKLESQFAVLKGKYDAEVPRLAEQLKTTVEQLARANEIIARQSELLSAPPKVETTPEPAAAPDITINPEDYESFGPEVTDLAKAYNSLVARLGTAQAPGKDLARIEENLKVVNQNQAASAFERFQSSAFGLAAQATGLTPAQVDAIDASDDGFKEWLKADYGFSGQTRGQILSAAADAMDSNRAAQVFIAYITESGKSSAKKGPGLNDLVIAPTGGGAGDPQPSASNELEASRKQYLQANEDFIKGRITEAQHDAITATYQNALQRVQTAA